MFTNIILYYLWSKPKRNKPWFYLNSTPKTDPENYVLVHSDFSISQIHTKNSFYNNLNEKYLETFFSLSGFQAPNSLTRRTKRYFLWSLHIAYTDYGLKGISFSVHINTLRLKGARFICDKCIIVETLELYTLNRHIN